MNNLPPDALQLLEVARDAMTPSDEDRVRVRRNLLAATAATGALTAASGVHATASASSMTASMTASSALKAGVGTWLGGGAKWLVAAALTGTVASATYYATYYATNYQWTAKPADAARMQQTGATRRVHASSAAAPRAVAEPQAVAQAGLPAAQTQPVPAVVPTAGASEEGRATIPTHARALRTLQLTAAKHQAWRERSPAAAPSTAVATTGAATTTAAGAQGAARPQIEEEISLVRGASVALREGRPQAALELLRQHAARFPGGMMSEERDGLRVLSLCAAGERDAAAHAAAAFLVRSPHSPLAAHVRKGCDATP